LKGASLGSNFFVFGCDGFRRIFLTVSSRAMTPLYLVAIAAPLLYASIAMAQSVSYSQMVIGSGLNDPNGVAVDGQGNVYIADYNNGRVLRVPPNDPACSTAGDCTNVGAGLQSPAGVAVDGQGNVYIADPNFGTDGSGRVLEAPAGDLTCAMGQCMDVGNSLHGASGVAVDAQGNVYVTIASDDVNTVVKILATDLSCSTASDCTNVGSGLQSPGGIAVDGQGNVYIADVLNNRVLKVPASDPSCSTPSHCTTIGSGLSYPTGVAVDGLGNVYIADTRNARVLKVPASDPTCSTAGDCTTIGSGLSAPSGVALDSQGNVFISDRANNVVLKVQMVSVDFGSVNVGSSKTLTLDYTIPAGAIGSVNYLTHGATNLDFHAKANDTSTTLCRAGSYTSVTTCTVDLTFAPAWAGQLNGVVQLRDGSGNLLASTLIYGVGQGAQIAYGNGVLRQIPVAASIGAIAVDGAGNLYTLSGRGPGYSLFKFPVIGTGYGSPVQLADGIQPDVNGGGITVDGAGNVFFADAGHNLIEELPWNGSSYAQPVSIPSGLNPGWTNPTAVAIDAQENLYVTDAANFQVVEVPWTSSGYGTGMVLSGGNGGNPHPWGQLWGVAVDGSRNVFFADGTSNTVEELPWTGSGYGSAAQIAYAPLQVMHVAVDGVGNVYYSDDGSGRIYKVSPQGGGWSPPIMLASGGGSTDMAVDAGANVYFNPQNPGNQILKLDFAGVPALSFATPTQVGTTDTADGPQNLTITNIGNQPLVFSVPSSGTNPSYPANFPKNASASNLCGGSALGVEASCVVSANFAPNAAGANQGTILLTDNNLSAPSTTSTQSIPLTGTGK
jgi:sugar lactone lactonase YvrE